MEFKELVIKNRSYRRFDQNHSLDKDLLLELVDHARCTPSAKNRQLLRYVVTCSSEINGKIFTTLGWANSIPDWPGPEEGERPTGYIIIAAKKSSWDWVKADLGISAQTILLASAAKGLGGCMLASLRKNRLQRILELEEDLEILLVIALGKPVETVVLEDVGNEASLTYFRTEDRVHHVPKLELEDLVLRVYD